MAGRSTPRRSTRNAGAESENNQTTPIKQEDGSPRKANAAVKRSAASSTPQKSKRVKIEEADQKQPAMGLPSPSESDSELSEPPSELDFSDADTKKLSKSKISEATKSSPAKGTKSSPDGKAAALQAKKLKSYSQFSKVSPFPDFPHPTPEEARLAHKILSSLHGERKRPETVVARSDRAGCGDSPSVLDALVRTILSQNTSDKNSTRAKLSMNEVYGGSDEWENIVKGGQAKLQETIKSGGLSVVKSKVIISILKQVKEKYGKYSLDHLFEKSNEEAMTELISFQGVGPKTASCVLLFCLQRESFAVDTHVYRIAGLLGWRPKNASRDETHAHLEVMIPDEEKYGLHILMVGHGKKCEECKAGGKSVGKCELRKAFRHGKLEGEAGEGSKQEEKEVVKQEDKDVEEDEDVQEGWESGQDEYMHGMQVGKSKNSKKTKGRK